MVVLDRACIIYHLHATILVGCNWDLVSLILQWEDLPGMPDSVIRHCQPGLVQNGKVNQIHLPAR